MKPTRSRRISNPSPSSETWSYLSSPQNTTQHTMADTISNTDTKYSDLTVTTPLQSDRVQIPTQIVERTQNLLSFHPMTNRSIVTDTMQWWQENAANPAIFTFCVHHLFKLTVNHDDSDVSHLIPKDVYDNAVDQAESIGILPEDNR